MDFVMERTHHFDAFEDTPWFLLYRECAVRYPDARFILTLRRDATTWLRSGERHDKRENQAGQIAACAKQIFIDYYSQKGIDFNDPESLYAYHNKDVAQFFAAQPHRLLTVCWENGDGWQELSNFLRQASPSLPFPHENASPGVNTGN